MLKSLNTKGINEKHLHESINMLVKEEIIRNLTPEEENSETGTMSLEPCSALSVYSDYSFKQKIIEDILSI